MIFFSMSLCHQVLLVLFIPHRIIASLCHSASCVWTLRSVSLLLHKPSRIHHPGVTWPFPFLARSLGVCHCLENNTARADKLKPLLISFYPEFASQRACLLKGEHVSLECLKDFCLSPPYPIFHFWMLWFL